MATGSSDASLATDTSDALDALIEADEPVTLIAAPAVRQVLAVAALASLLDAPHVRIVGPDRPAVEQPPGPVVAAAPGLAEADVVLSPYTPLADLEAVLADRSVPGGLARTIEAVRLAGTDPAPGVVATHADLGASLEWSIRLDCPAERRPPFDGPVRDLTEADARALGSWIAATVAGEDSPTAAAAVATALAPTYLDDGPIPTAEGVVDVVSTAVEADPGRVLAAFIGGEGLRSLLDPYEAAVAIVDDTVSGLPAGEAEAVVAADAGEAPPLATARRWAAGGLEGDYGVLLAGESPVSLALVAAGDRSASAVLETVTSRGGGASWGGPFLAGAILPERPADPTTTITNAL